MATLITLPSETSAALALLAEHRGETLAGIGARDGMFTVRFFSGARLALHLAATDLAALSGILPPVFGSVVLASCDENTATVEIAAPAGRCTFEVIAARVLDRVL